MNESDIYPYSVTDLSKKDALVIAPHPDDESLGCGGSIIKHIKAGSRVKIVFLTNGDKGDFEGRFGREYTKIRKKSAQKAMRILGVSDYEFWGYGDREFHLSVHEVKERLFRAIKTFVPSLIYVPSPFEAHPDHKFAFEVIWDLREKLGIALTLYEILMAIYPNVLVDITAEMKLKKKAIKSYFTEVHYNDYISKIKGLNRFRTATLSKDIKYAEAFFLYEKETETSKSFFSDLFLSAVNFKNTS